MSEKVKLAAASDEQLRQFAESHLGITFPANTKAETMRSKIAATWTKEEIIVPDAEPDTVQSGTPPQPARAKRKDDEEMVKLIIQAESEGANDPVELGCNGKIMLVPRGVEVEIPKRFFESLKNAVEHRPEALPDGGMGPVRKVMAYPFQRIH